MAKKKRVEKSGKTKALERVAGEKKKKSPVNAILAVVLVAFILGTWLWIWNSHRARDVWNNAVEAYGEKNYDKAIELFEYARSLNPDDETIKESFATQVGRCYLAKARKFEDDNKPLQAAGAYAEFIRVDEKGAIEADAFYQAALNYATARKKDKALEYAKRALKMAGFKHDKAKSLVTVLEKPAGKKSAK
jgi:tetratricopeptide (TPR) repeat protein